MRFPARFIILDFESTDLEVWKANGEIPEAIEIGAILVSSDLTVINQFSTLVKPQNISHVTPKISALTGISQSDLYSAPQWDEISSKFQEFTSGRSVSIYSFGGFLDAAILQHEYIRLGQDVPHRMPVFDLQSLFLSESLEKGYQITSVSLRAFAQLFDVSLEGQHRALKDCQICLDILKKFQPENEEFVFELYEF